MPIKHIVDINEFHKLKSTNKPIIVKFTATWCGPCKLIAPIFLKYANDQQYESIIFVEVDVDQGPEISEECRINSVPTFICFYKNNKIDDFSGAAKEKLDAMVSRAVGLF